MKTGLLYVAATIAPAIAMHTACETTNAASLSHSRVRLALLPAWMSHQYNTLHDQLGCSLDTPQL
jgi:hypothetical protein